MYSPLPWSCCLLESALRCSAVCTSSSNCGFFCSNSRSTFCNSTNTTHLHKTIRGHKTTTQTHKLLTLSRVNTLHAAGIFFSANEPSEWASEEMIFRGCFLRAPVCQIYAGVHRRTRTQATTKETTHQILIWLESACVVRANIIWELVRKVEGHTASLNKFCLPLLLRQKCCVLRTVTSYQFGVPIK